MNDNIVATLEIDAPVLQFSEPNMDIGTIVAVDYRQRNCIKLSIDNPLVSIIFVARNEDEWLRKSLDSLYNTVNDASYEVIVFDDFSTDDCATDLSLHVLLESKSQPVGPSRARNMGAINSRGQFLIFCDSHLKFRNHWIDDLIKPIQEGKCEAVNPIISDIAVPATKGFGWDFDLKSYTYKWATPTEEFKLVPGMAGGCFAIKREIFFEVGMFDRKFLKWGMEDSELGLRLILCGYRIGIEPKVDVGHFFKEVNEYGVDWFSYNYNFLRMAYVNMNDEDVDYVYSLIGGNEQERVNLLQVVKDTSKYRKKAMQHMRKLDFKDYKIQFGKVMS
jgi:glycosyltransferase involved in cell wall biosynthesis